MSQNQDYFISVIWEGDNHTSPNYSTRGNEYGLYYLPSAGFNGDTFDIGGGSAYNRYQNIYNGIVNQSSPIEIAMDLGVSGGQFAVIADVLMTETIPADDYRIIYMLKYYFSDSYNSTVVRYAEEDFNLTTSGSTQQFQHNFTFDPTWDVANIMGVVIIQHTNSTGTFVVNGYPEAPFSTYPILQAAQSSITGLLPMFSTNVTEGPAYLGVQFTSTSFPQTGIDMWEWDFDGDGTFDSTQENPYHLYTVSGVYDVTLRITVDGETEETTATELITVTDGSAISGNLSGAWLAGNEYTITGDVEIVTGDMLTIYEGAEINIENDAQFTVNGLLLADASETRSEPIIFTSDTSWNGIRFFSTQEENIIANCDISNTSDSAIIIEGDSQVDIVGCIIHDNNTSSQAAAIEIVGSNDVLISQNVIVNNTSSNCAGAIRCTASSPEISNNIVANNTGQWGAFSFKNDSNATLVNNTIANNLSTNASPYLFFLLSSVPVISNSIIIDNGEIYFPQSTPEITYSCVTGGFAGEGNIEGEPLFISPSDGDGSGYDGLTANWSLQTGSPCIDAGNPDAMYNDVDGSRNDMGAYGGPNGMQPTDSEDNTINIAAVNSISVYPNPFNPTANIALSINENDLLKPVSVKIFNIKGQLVRTIVNNEIMQNTTVVWNGKDNNGNSTSSGMYFVKMKTASSEVSKKMLLMK
ncbi:MAG: right-handed parallel beta-helix repeat-containing protein [Candidatus Tenebribacter davisii]|nr:right-handed parallel beta-helix repeat-containing protein [Candidatus Tenebribacter davisii]